MTLRFHLVDVFATEPLTGNPLADVENGDGLPLRVLQHIAREFNQSETTFVLTPTRAGADWRLRSFTAAGSEVFGAGHNALGACVQPRSATQRDDRVREVLQSDGRHLGGPGHGTAAGPLAAHLVAHGLAEAEHVLPIEQGTAIGRTSLVRVGMGAGIPSFPAGP